MQPFELAVIIGRFQPLHYGHEELVKLALLKAKKVMILVGSSQESRTTKNPFSFYERRNMFETTFVDYLHRLHIRPLMDYDTNEEWTQNVHAIVNSVCSDNSKVCMIVCDKDNATLESNNLLRSLPYTVFPSTPYLTYNATTVRKALFEGDNPLDLIYLPKPVQKYLSRIWPLVKRDIEQNIVKDEGKKKWYQKGVFLFLSDIVVTVVTFVICF